MQNTATFRTATRGAAQLLVLAAVAAVGVSVGRWVIPESGTSGATVSAPVAHSASTMERKFAQMDARDDRFGFAAAAPVAHNASMERKLAQMDARDDRSGFAAAGAAAAPAPHGASTMEQKLAQMDAWDDRFGFVAAPASYSPSTMERKLAQMDAEDAR